MCAWFHDEEVKSNVQQHTHLDASSSLQAAVGRGLSQTDAHHCLSSCLLAPPLCVHKCTLTVFFYIVVRRLQTNTNHLANSSFLKHLLFL